MISGLPSDIIKELEITYLSSSQVNSNLVAHLVGGSFSLCAECIMKWKNK